MFYSLYINFWSQLSIDPYKHLTLIIIWLIFWMFNWTIVGGASMNRHVDITTVYELGRLTVEMRKRGISGNSPADAAESQEAKKVCKRQVWSLQRERCRSTNQHNLQQTDGFIFRSYQQVANTVEKCLPKDVKTHLSLIFRLKYIFNYKECYYCRCFFCRIILDKYIFMWTPSVSYTEKL